MHTDSSVCVWPFYCCFEAIFPNTISVMAAPNASRSRFRSLSQKISGPTFRSGIGEVYRQLEREGKIPAEGIEKKAEYEAKKAAKEEALARPKGFAARIKQMFKWFGDQLD